MYLYIEKDTWIHKLHPITKIFSLISIFTLTLLVEYPNFLIYILIFIIILSVISKTTSNLIKTLPFCVSLMIFCSVIWTFFRKGEIILFRLGDFPIYKESLFYGISMGLRLISMLLSGLIFLGCTKIEECIYALRRLGIPYPFCFAMSFAFRLVPTFMETVQIISQAQKARGLELEKGNLLQRLKNHAPILVPTFLYGIKKCDLMAIALELRGFGLKRKRTFVLDIRASWKDYFTVFLFIGAVIFMMILRFFKKCIY